MAGSFSNPISKFGLKFVFSSIFFISLLYISEDPAKKNFALGFIFFTNDKILCVKFKFVLKYKIHFQMSDRREPGQLNDKLRLV